MLTGFRLHRARQIGRVQLYPGDVVVHANPQGGESQVAQSILGTLEVESRPGLGTVYRISLVKVPVPDRARA